MKTLDVLLSGHYITEDEYNFKGQFILSYNNKSLNVDISDLENIRKINEIKKHFELDESSEEIRKILMDMVMEKAAIISKVTEGENYEQQARRG